MSFEKGDRVRAEPVVGPAEGGVMHKVFEGTVTTVIPEDEPPWEGEEVVWVDPDGDDDRQPVRANNCEPLEAADE